MRSNFTVSGTILRGEREISGRSMEPEGSPIWLCTLIQTWNSGLRLG